MILFTCVLSDLYDLDDDLGFNLGYFSSKQLANEAGEKAILLRKDYKYTKYKYYVEEIEVDKNLDYLFGN
jgi:hypothetical protein